MIVATSAGRDALIALAGFGAGAVNAIAGGGTLVSFPTLLALGYPALTANTTSTTGIWPGFVGGAAGFWPEVRGQGRRLRFLGPVALVGAVIGSVLLLVTPAHSFARVAPWLVLTASALFVSQPLLRHLLQRRRRESTRHTVLLGGLLLGSVYGGYFGAGLGVMLLAVLGVTLPDTLYRTSGLRSALSVVINGVAALVFVADGSVAWVAAGLLAGGSVIGGFAGAVLARRIPAALLRIVIALVGTATALKLLTG